jgi:hypothetical protein
MIVNCEWCSVSEFRASFVGLVMWSVKLLAVLGVMVYNGSFDTEGLCEKCTPSLFNPSVLIGRSLESADLVQTVNFLVLNP